MVLEKRKAFLRNAITAIFVRSQFMVWRLTHIPMKTGLAQPLHAFRAVIALFAIDDVAALLSGSSARLKRRIRRGCYPAYAK